LGVIALAAVGTYLAAALVAFRVVVVNEDTFLVAVAASYWGPGIIPLATAYPCPYSSQ